MHIFDDTEAGISDAAGVVSTCLHGNEVHDGEDVLVVWVHLNGTSRQLHWRQDLRGECKFSSHIHMDGQDSSTSYGPRASMQSVNDMHCLLTSIINHQQGFTESVSCKAEERVSRARCSRYQHTSWRQSGRPPCAPDPGSRAAPPRHPAPGIRGRRLERHSLFH